MHQNQRIVEPRILALPAFRKQQFADYYSIFSEARLSALGICLFFAALKQSPATGLRLLALDDILIGLDMGNRLNVLGLVHEHFADWQILIFTYSKAWFERLKDLVKTLSWSAPWESVVLWEEWHGTENSPRIVAAGSGDLLESAAQHLKRKDYKAAAVYARSALEALCHRTCAKASLPVKHVEQPKERKLEDYLVVLEKRLIELTDEKRYAIALKLVTRLREAQSFVLNQNSHFDVEEEDTLSGEVRAAIGVVKDLTDFFLTQSWKRSNFTDGKVLSAVERTGISLAESRKLVAFHQPAEAVKRLVDAHHAAWEAYGEREEVCLPIGNALDAKRIWEAALAQTKLDAGLDAQLKAARPYLFGNIEEKDFDRSKFEEAVRLLEGLVALAPNIG
jgi:HEPN domain-containing protein